MNVVIWRFINKVDLNNCFFPKVCCRIRVRVIICDDRPQRVTLLDSYFKIYIFFATLTYISCSKHPDWLNHANRKFEEVGVAAVLIDDHV